MQNVQVSLGVVAFNTADVHGSRGILMRPLLLVR